MTVGSLVRTTFRHRAVIVRNATSSTDVMGHPEAPSFAAHTTLPCRFWSQRRREVIDGKKSALVEDLRCGFAKDADVTADDRVSSIQDRQGSTLISGPLRLVAPQYKHDHIEFSLERITS